MLKHETIKKFSAVFLSTALAALIVVAPAFALADGSYVVKRTASYADPATGKPVDGGDLALGNEMSNDIIEDTVLVEQVGGRTFVTMGLNLANQISDAKFAVQDSAGNYVETEAVDAGSSGKGDDMRVYMRFETFTPESLIRPTLDVIPMGREVTCFVTLDIASAKPGTGQFTSTLVDANGKPTADFDALAPTKLTDTKPLDSDTAAQEESKKTETPADKSAGNSEANPTPISWIIIVGAAVVVIGAGAGILYSRSKKSKRIPQAEQVGSLKPNDGSSTKQDASDESKN